MKSAFFLDGVVGRDILNFISENFYEDIAFVVSIEKNVIWDLAKDLNLNVFLYNEVESLIENKKIKFDNGFLIWWPKIIPEKILIFPENGFINTHPSFLPFQRGKFPSFWSQIEETKYGVTLHKVDIGIDSGPILFQKEIVYTLTDTGRSLYDKSIIEMINLFKNKYPIIRKLEYKEIEQDKSLATYHSSSEVEKKTRIDLGKKYYAKDLINMLKARNYGDDFPSCYFEMNGETFDVRAYIKKRK